MQFDLFETVKAKETKSIDTSEWGTFRDSLRAPVHGWFTYPAGFSYKAVEHSIVESKLRKGKDIIYDPFMGSGTTNIVAKNLGFNSVGVEAHPFVFQITKAKLNWDLKFDYIQKGLFIIEKEIGKTNVPNNLQEYLSKNFPELILKCFLPETLFELLVIRNSLRKIEEIDINAYNFFKIALICVLRDVSIAATGWPYIAPNKIKITSMSKKGWHTYQNRVLKMFGDILEIRKKTSLVKTKHAIILGDSRNTKEWIEDESVDHIFTSPPYLNNFDYADRTRLEMYFMGDAKNWGEISNQVRTKLMTSATTQINRNDSKYIFSNDFQRECNPIYLFLNDAVEKLTHLRIHKGGKKSYDLLTIGYFNDIYQILKDNFRVLKPRSKAIYILGDSAPYGIHIPTDELIGKIGMCIGFKNYNIIPLRARGGKWEKNPQRHSVALKEAVVILKK